MVSHVHFNKLPVREANLVNVVQPETGPQGLPEAI